MNEAKEFYMKWNGSKAAMFREDYPTYLEYCQSCPNKPVRKWKEELLKRRLDTLKETGSVKEFYSIEELIDGEENKESLEIFLEAISYVQIKDGKTSLTLAESLMGRRDLSLHEGPIFLAKKTGNEELVAELLQMVRKLIDIDVENDKMKERIERDRNRLSAIVEVVKSKCV